MTQTDFYKREYSKDHYGSEHFNSVRLGSAWIMKYIYLSINGDEGATQFLDLIILHLKKLKITSLCYLSIGVYRPIRASIEEIHSSVFGNNDIEWYDPFISQRPVKEDSPTYFDDHKTNVVLARITVELFTFKKLTLKPEHDQIQFIKDLILIKNHWNERDYYFTFPFYEILLKEAIPENKFIPVMSEVNDIDYTSDTTFIVGNGFSIDINNRIGGYNFDWGTTYETLKDSLEWLYDRLLKINKHILNKYKVGSNENKIMRKAIKKMKQRQTKMSNPVKFWKFYLMNTEFLWLVRSQWSEYMLFITQTKTLAISNKETTANFKKWIVERTYLTGDEFHLRDDTAEYIYSVDLKDIFFGNIEFLQIAIDKLSIDKTKQTIYLDSIHAMENIMIELYKNWKINTKIYKEYSFKLDKINPNSNFISLNYGDAGALFFKNAWYPHGRFDESYEVSNIGSEVEINNILQDDSAWEHILKSNIGSSFNLTYSTILKAADYKFRHIMSQKERFVKRGLWEKSTYYSLIKISEIKGDVIIFGTTLKQEFHILGLLNPKEIGNIYFAYHSEADKDSIHWAMIALELRGHDKKKMFIIKSYLISSKFIITKNKQDDI